jgi:hypothetical protein
MLQHRTEIQDAGMAMPAASTSIPMPSYAKYDKTSAYRFRGQFSKFATSILFRFCGRKLGSRRKLKVNLPGKY